MRCIQHKLGHCMQLTCSLWTLDRAHQLPRVVGSTAGPAEVLTPAPGQAHVAPDGQLCDNGIYKLPGRHTLMLHVTSRLPSPPLVSAMTEVTTSHSHPRRAQSCSRCILVMSDALRRVETPSPSSAADLESIRQSTGSLDIFASQESSHCLLCYSLTEALLCTYALAHSWKQQALGPTQI